jgi:hypothetical protein
MTFEIGPLTTVNDQIRWHHRLTQTAESHGVIAGGSQR